MSLKVSNISIRNRLIYFIKYNKTKLLIVLTGIMVMILLLNSLDLVFADDDVGFLGNLALSMVKGIVSPDLFTKIAEEVRVSISGGSVNIGGRDISGIGNAVSGINGYLVGVGTVVAMILWFPTLASSFISGSAYAELLIKKFVMLGISIFMVVNSLEISTQIVNVGAEVTEQVAGYISGLTPDQNAYDRIKASILEEMPEYEDPPEPTYTGSWWQQLIQWLGNVLKNIFGPLLHWLNWKILRPIAIVFTVFVPWIAIRIITALCSVFTISRGVELLILVTMSPIPFAIVGNQPLGDGTGARFIRNLFAVSMQGAVMLIIAYISQALMNSILGSVTGYEDLAANAMWQLIAVAAAELGLLMKSLTISQKVFGLQ